MLPRFEYGNLYKFLVSLGLLLIALAIAVPWLVLREDGALLVPEATLDTLTPIARQVLIDRQRQHRWVLDHYWWGSLAFAASGLGLAIYGGFRWSRRQAVLNRQEDATTQLTEREVLRQSVVEVESNRDVETQEIVEAEQSPTEPSVRLIRQELVEIEAVVFARLHEAFSGTHEVLPNVKVSDVGFDLLMLSKTLDAPDYVIELKYVRQTAEPMRRVREAVEQARAGVQAFVGARPNPTWGLALVVMDGAEIRTPVKRSEPMTVRTLALTKDSLLTMPADELRRRVEAAFAEGA